MDTIEIILLSIMASGILVISVALGYCAIKKERKRKTYVTLDRHTPNGRLWLDVYASVRAGDRMSNCK